MEQWKDVDWIDGYAGVLQVSDSGRVRRHSYSCITTGRWGTPHITTKPNKILSPYVGRHGYPTIAVQIDGRRKKFLVHRLVARAFADGFREDLTVNHINGVKTDNRASNLEWVTLGRNTELQWLDALVDLRGDKSPNRKLNSSQVRIMRRLLKLGATPNELADLVRVSPRTIYKIRDGATWASVQD